MIMSHEFDYELHNPTKATL